MFQMLGVFAELERSIIQERAKQFGVDPSTE
jgi:DNA invertase Pin-like site-specific DNA recombinase